MALHLLCTQCPNRFCTSIACVSMVPRSASLQSLGGSGSHLRILRSPFTLKHATMISGVLIEIKSCPLSIHVRCVGILCCFYMSMSHAGHGSRQDPALFFFATTFSFRMATLRRSPILPRLISGNSLLQHDVAVPFLLSK